MLCWGVWQSSISGRLTAPWFNKPLNASPTFLCSSPNMAQFLQGLMEEGMGGMETPPTASEPARAVMWIPPPPPQPYTVRATQYTPSPDLTPATGQQLWPTTLQRRPLPPSPGPGGATVGMSPRGVSRHLSN